MEWIMKNNDFQIKVLERLNGIETKQAEMNVSLDEHMRRTELLESSIETVKTDLKPVQKHVSMLEGSAKLLGFVGIVSSICYSIVRMINILF